MPSWADENERYWWIPPGKYWFERVEIPHPPVIQRDNCICDFCQWKDNLDNEETIKNGKFRQWWEYLMNENNYHD